MEMSDAIAAYAAVVASILAIIQLRDHRTAKKILKIRQSDEFRISDGYVAIAVTNLSDREVSVDFIGFGIGYRPWVKPWSVHLEEADSLELVTLNGSQEIPWREPMRPGQMLYAEHVGPYKVPKAKSLWDSRGFDRKLRLTITHSMSERDLIEVLT